MTNFLTFLKERREYILQELPKLRNELAAIDNCISIYKDTEFPATNPVLIEEPKPKSPRGYIHDLQSKEIVDLLTHILDEELPMRRKHIVERFEELHVSFGYYDIRKLTQVLKQNPAIFESKGKYIGWVKMTHKNKTIKNSTAEIQQPAISKL